jgi:ferric-dicitrate binding protein FerR (iron transport regulator)
MSKDKFEIIVTKILTSEETKEMNQFHNYLEQEEYLKKYSWLKENFDNARYKPSTKFNYERGLNSLRAKIEQAESENREKKRNLRRIVSIAATIAILTTMVFIGKNYFTSNLKNYSEYTAIKGERKQITLPDNSIVCLNSGTTVKVASNFRKNRKIVLDGEAYFEVIKNEAQPFKVETKSAYITVLGTAFIVSAVPDRPEIVSVRHGKVNVKHKQNNSSENLVLMETAMINSNGLVKSKITNSEIVFGWTENKLVFENQSLQQIKFKLEQWYGIDIIIDPAISESNKITGTYKDLNIYELMKIIQYSLPIRYTFEHDTLNILFNNNISE